MAFSLKAMNMVYCWNQLPISSKPKCGEIATQLS